jgi:sialate O-acetylesterase
MTPQNNYKRVCRYVRRKTSLCLLILLYALPSQALRLPALIGTNMVLQRGRPVPLWGWGTPAEKITVEFRGSRFTTTVGKDSAWEVLLGSYEAGGPYEMRIDSKDSSIQLNNILVGDVWLSSGQSNMEFGIQTEREAQQVMSSPQDSMIHFFFVPWCTALSPRAETLSAGNNSLNGHWVVCSVATLQANWAWHGFSAVSYYFARDIRKATGVPLGFIGSYKGGTPAQSWISEGGVQKDPALLHYAEQHQKIVQQYPDRQKSYDTAMKVYRQETEQWNADQSKPRPKQPAAPDGGFSAPFNLFNGMIAPLLKYPLKGVLWYQGESNGDKLADAIEYRQLFPALINDWRTQWKQPGLPFLFVQLTSYRKAAVTPAEGIWPWVREAQQQALSLPATGMAVITDIGDGADIHPKNKKDVGIRLALLTRRIVYHENMVASGPRLRSYKQQGNKIILTFSDTGKGLLIKDSTGNTTLKGFGIAGKDKVFHWAHADIKGNQVIVYSEEVSAPVAVRYNWADNPPGNLYNQEGLPAAPLRTDDWEADPDYTTAPLLEWEKKFTDFAFRKVEENGHVLPYRFYQPANLNPNKKYPLVLFFHGAGERGDDNRKQFLRFPTVRFWETTPCYVLAPQCPVPPKGGPDGEAVWVQTGFGWPSHTMKAKPSWPMQLSMELLDSVIKQYHIDTARIYVTGLSMGGFATWEILQREGERFAAAVPVCGGADTSYASKMTNIPIWALHGDADSTVWPSRSIDIVKAIERSGGNKVKLTIYPGVGHGAWTPTYSNPEVWNWLFTHTKQPAVKPISR